MIPTREQAWGILTKYVTTDVSESTAWRSRRPCAISPARRGQDEELWGVVGLLPRVDYELYPEEHCLRAREILQKEGVDEGIIHAVQSHGYEICCDIAPENDMERALFAVDELTGLVTAAAILRPSHSVMDLEVKSVKKKFKDRHFAAGCNRDVIRRGVERMGISLRRAYGGRDPGHARRSGRAGPRVQG